MQLTTWQVVASVAAAVSAMMACVAAGLSWRSSRRAERMFELQRRPWLRLGVDTGHPTIDLKGEGLRMAWLVLENYGAGGAHDTRVGARFNTTDLPLHERSHVWARDPDGQEFRGEQLLLCSPGERTPYSAVMPWVRVDGVTPVFLHAFCVYSGGETGQRYYSEAVFLVSASLRLVRHYQGCIRRDSSVAYERWAVRHVSGSPSA